MATLRRALEYVKQLSTGPRKRKYPIFSDSLSAIAAPKKGSCQARPNLFGKAIRSIAGKEADTVLVGVPTHVSVPGSEKADQLANEGMHTDRTKVDHDIGLEFHNEYSNVNRYVESQWQQQWEADTTERLYQQIGTECPTGSQRSKPKSCDGNTGTSAAYVQTTSISWRRQVCATHAGYRKQLSITC